MNLGDLLEIIHARHKKASTIFCSQFAPAGWYKKFTEAPIADTILGIFTHPLKPDDAPYLY